MDQLFERHIEVMKRSSAGISQQEIADQLGVSRPMFNNFMTVTYRLMGAKNRVSALRMFWEWEREQEEDQVVS